MPAYITPGEVFTTSAPGKSVTSARMNNHVGGLTILPAFFTDQTEATSATIADDYVLIHSAAATAFRKLLLSHFFDQIPTDAAAGVGSLRTLGNTGLSAAKGVSTPNLASDNQFTGTNQFTRIGGTYQGVLAIAPGAGLGTGGTPSAGFAALSTGLYGRIVLIAASTASNGLLATVTLDATFLNIPFVTLVPYNATAIALQSGTSKVSVQNVTTTGFEISNTVNLQNNGNYQYNYFILGK